MNDIRLRKRNGEIEPFIQNEEWKVVKGYGNYLVSNCGRVYSIFKKYLLTPIKQQDTGYLTVNLHIDKQKNTMKKKRIHVLVAENFIEENEKPFINHKDGDKLNNQVSNLERVTHAENMQHAYKTGLKNGQKGESNGSSKLSDTEVCEIKKLLKQGIKKRFIVSRFNLSNHQYDRIRTGEHYGWIAV